MTTKERQHQKTKIQYHSNRYTLTIPKWIVEKVLCAKQGSVINFDFRGNKVILEKEILERENNVLKGGKE